MSRKERVQAGAVVVQSPEATSVWARITQAHSKLVRQWQKGEHLPNDRQARLILKATEVDAS